jgi:hypothetical protein
MKQLIKKNKIFGVICAFIIFFALLFWFHLKDILFNSQANIFTINFLYFFLNLILLVAFFCLSFLLLEDVKKVFFLIILAIAPIFFIVAPNIILILSSLIFLLLAFLGFRAIKYELNQRINIDIYSTSYFGIAHILSGFFVLIACFYYLSALSSPKNLDISIPQPIAQKAIDFVQTFINQQNLTQPQKLELEPSENLINFLNQQLKIFILSFKNYIVVLLSIGIFLGLRAFNFIFIPIIAFLTTMFFKLFILLKFISIGEKNIIAKKIIIN